jgi:hypothetical protein
MAGRRSKRAPSFYGQELAHEHQKLLEKAALGPQLGQELGVVRLWVRLLLRGTDLGPGGIGETSALLVRLLELMTRMARVQARVGDAPVDRLAELTEIVRKRLAEGATPEEAMR